MSACLSSPMTTLVKILCRILDYWGIEQYHSRLDAPKMFNLDATQHFSFNYSSSVLGITKSDAASSAGLGRS